MMTNDRRLAALALIVPDYDQAISYYVETLGFRLIEDTALSASKRWVLISPGNKNSCNLLLAKATTAEQQAAIGNQAGGRVFLVLYTDNFDRDYQSYKMKDVTFLEEPRSESYGKVVVFQDMFGNKWDLLEPADQE